MSALLMSLLIGLTVHLEGTVEDLELIVTNSTGEVVGQVAAPTPGDYVFDELTDGSYTIRAVVRDTVLASVTDIVLPTNEPVEITVANESVEQAGQQTGGARRNQNIQVNLIDTQALIESLGRQGAQVRPITEFSATRQNYAVELGGVGPSPRIVPTDQRSAYHGELFDTHNNHTMNARTFFQVGEVMPSRRNQYGFRFGGPLGSDRLSFLVTGDETRDSGFVNGNVLVPLPNERTPTANEPAARALIQKWLDAYPNELPNRTEIDRRLLNTNAVQKVRNTGGSLKLDWQRTENQKVAVRYSFSDNLIDGFELVGGQNPDQRLRPQTLNLTWEQQLSETTVLRTGVNYLRRKVHVLLSPNAVGPFVNASGLAFLGPSFELPIRRVSNEFEYLLSGSTSLDTHQIDWGGFIQRTQWNEFQADAQRGVYSFRANFGHATAIDAFLAGEATRYTTIFGELYRGYRMTDFSAYANDRIRLGSNLHLTLGVRYEYVDKPSEANNLTSFAYSSDTNNIAPRIGLAWTRGSTTVRAGYGVAYGQIFPATFRIARLNPPDVLWVRIQAPPLIDPVGEVNLSGESPIASQNRMDPNLVAPYSQHYSLDVSQELPGDVTVRASYIGSRTWKLFRIVRENRAVPVEGIPFETRTIDLRRPDPTAQSIGRMTNQARAYFDAGQFSINKAFSQGLALRGSYTWSKALDTGSDFSNPGTNQQERIAQDESRAVEDLKSLSSFDTPHSVVLAYSLELPTRFLRGWTVSGTTILKDGTPFTVETGNDAPPFGNADGERNDRPSIVDPSQLGVSVDNPDTALGVLRRDIFDPTAPSRAGYGNLARNSFRKDGTTNFNLAISRTFTLPGDHASLQFRTEFINAFNHPQFAPPNSRMAADSFGQITNTQNDGRNVQFYLRLIF
jgi:hypothetical protein